MSIFKKLQDHFTAKKAAQVGAKVGESQAIAEATSIMAGARQTGKLSGKGFYRLQALKKANGLWWEDFADHKGEVDDLCRGRSHRSNVVVLEKNAPAAPDSPKLAEARLLMSQARSDGEMSNETYRELKALVKATKGLVWEDFANTIGEANSLNARYQACKGVNARAA
jgi:electron transfer flavoprotein alpha subunit